jgi:cytochrome c oxidase subunit 2
MRAARRPRTAGWTRRRLLLTAPFLILLSGCAAVPATEQGGDVHSLYRTIFLLAAPVVVIVEGFLLWMLWRYRRHTDEEPPQSFGTRRALVIFFLIPTVIVGVDYGFGEATLASVDRIDPNPQVVIRAEGFQWEWTFYYLNEGFFTTGKTLTEPAQMEIPVDEPVKILLHSRDVIHSFFVPSFLFKRDVIPGRTNQFTFTATQLGVYKGQCAEFCGLYHSRMTFYVHVVTASDYSAWVRRARNAALHVTCPSSGAHVRVTAKNTQWNTNCIAVASNQQIALSVSNQDPAIDHNFAVYDSSKRTKQFFQTGRFPGVATKDFAIGPLPPGRYYFQCDVHGPAMSGVYIVTP